MTDWPPVYLSAGLRLVPVVPGTKRPYASETLDQVTGWHEIFIGDVDTWRRFQATHPGCNLAILCSTIAQVDMDSPDAEVWATDHGLTVDGVWVLRTGRGWRYFFKAPTSAPRTYTDPEHQIADLLAPPHLALVPPSVHPNGRPYQWLPGRTPADIPPEDLGELPRGILTAWEALAMPRPAIHRRQSTPPGWLGYVYDAIADALEAAGHRFQRGRDGGIITTCPLHDDRNPSFSMHPERGWICYAGCGQGRLTVLAKRLGVRIEGAS